ncbi:MAG: hypothetical protein IKA22_03795 [Lentisphaeria bacterium]|nr:hypothetical protein [Lentisphaeria bacterium]
MNSDLYRIKLSTGTVYQTSKGGNYYFRYQINGERKCVISVELKTTVTANVTVVPEPDLTGIAFRTVFHAPLH